MTWPPGAPVMAELDSQWHLSEKLLLQGPAVGSFGSRIGWDGIDEQMLETKKQLVVRAVRV